MRVRCRATRLTTEELASIGTSVAEEQASGLSAGEDYLVLGLQFETSSVVWGTGPWVRIAIADDIRVAPLCLFEIIDDRVSRHWQARHWKDGSVTLWPAPFYVDYFLGDLKRGKPGARAELHRVRELLEAEANER